MKSLKSNIANRNIYFIWRRNLGAFKDFYNEFYNLTYFKKIVDSVKTFTDFMKTFNAYLSLIN